VAIKELKCGRERRLLMLVKVEVMRFSGHVVSSAAVINDAGLAVATARSKICWSTVATHHARDNRSVSLALGL